MISLSYLPVKILIPNPQLFLIQRLHMEISSFQLFLKSVNFINFLFSFIMNCYHASHQPFLHTSFELVFRKFNLPRLSWISDRIRSIGQAKFSAGQLPQ